METIVHQVAEFGAALKQRQKELGYAQSALAKLCGTGTRFISDLENGKPTVELGKALMVARALGIDLVARPRSLDFEA